MMRYVLGWDAGATAEIELHMPTPSRSTFGLRYNSPYRSTFRSPTEALRVGPGALEQSRIRLQQLASSLQLIPGRGPGGGAGGRVEATRTLEDIGRELYELVLPSYIQADLLDPLFVELAVDEEMLTFPWELMYDDEQFLGHKHALGRYVNLKQPLLGQVSRPYGVGAVLEELKVLIIGVPRPQSEDSIEELTAVEPEIRAITDTLTSIGIEPTLLFGRDADYDSVRAELRKEYHIIHFSGHATFDDDTPNRSALLLFDAKIETGAIMASFSRHPAILCFVNACEAARTIAADDQRSNGEEGGAEALPGWESRYNNYGLARAFLETGSYLLGSRWRLEDEPAQIFAGTFYEAALRRGDPLGRAIAAARAETARRSTADSCAWASYVYYGDPRVSFRPEPSPKAQERPRVPRIKKRRAAPQVTLDADLLQRLAALARAYDNIRQSQPPGLVRTSEMTRLSREAARAASGADTTSLVPYLFASSDGGRVVALAILRESPDPRHFDSTLSAITGPRSAFEQYLALEVMRALVPFLNEGQTGKLREAIDELSQRADFFGTDRYVLANQIATQLSGTVAPVLA